MGLPRHPLFGAIRFEARRAVAVADFFVDGVAGSDTYDGLAMTHEGGTRGPKATIQAGLDLLTSGKKLKIKSGTYAGAGLNQKTFTDWTTIETDDDFGNPGTVNITTPYTAPLSQGNAGLWFGHTDYLRLDGRQRGGFNIEWSTGSWQTGLHAYVDTSIMGRVAQHLKVLNVRVKGPVTSAGKQGMGVTVQNYGDTEIAYCDVDTRGSVSGTMICEVAGPTYTPSPVGDEPDPHVNPAYYHNVHHCTFQGQTNEGYNALAFTRADRAHAHHNVFFNVYAAGQGSDLIRSRQSHDCRFYRNVFWVNGGADCHVRSIGMFRGMMNQDYLGGANRCWFFNNTIVLDEALGGGFVFSLADACHAPKVFNNLVLGNVGTFLSGFDKFETSGVNDAELASNVVTGTVSNWFNSAATQAKFSVNANNGQEQGTAFLRQTGDKPSPFWQLTASKDGRGTIPGAFGSFPPDGSADFPALDYDGQMAATPPDVGAFEFGG